MAGAPRLSVVIPTFNRAPVLAKCLDALLAQDAASACELVVADDGSSDATRACVEQRAGGRARVVYLHQANAGANAARNRAVEAARGELLLFINDDTIATPAMIAQHLAGHAAHPEENVAVLGRVTVSPELPSSRLAPLHLDRAFARLDGQSEHDWRAFLTCNVSVKRRFLRRAGPFEERLRYHEDLELAERLSHHGLRVVYRPQALGYHDHLLTEAEFLAIAAREARALAVWASIAPQLKPLLGSLGFEPALPAGRRLKHQVLRLAINDATVPAWCALARSLPAPMGRLSLTIYNHVYQCVRRAHLRRELGAQGS